MKDALERIRRKMRGVTEEELLAALEDRETRTSFSGTTKTLTFWMSEKP